MKISRLSLAVIGACLFCHIFTVNSDAQYGRTKSNKKSKGFSIKAIKVRRLRESSESGSLSAVKAPKYGFHWYRVTSIYSSKPQWADGVVLRYYVLLEEKGSGKKYTMLTGKVEYDSVPRANNHYSFLFIHPRTVDRYGKPEKVMCEVWHDGVRVSRGVWPKKSNDEWWVRFRPLEGNLKVKFFTPFALDRDLKEENINIKSLLSN